jgi:formiminotetrahydrofolate cyclodeaminase
VQPLQYQMTPSPFGGGASALAGKVGGGLGSQMAGMFTG